MGARALVSQHVWFAQLGFEGGFEYVGLAHSFTPRDRRMLRMVRTATTMDPTMAIALPHAVSRLTDSPDALLFLLMLVEALAGGSLTGDVLLVLLLALLAEGGELGLHLAYGHLHLGDVPGHGLLRGKQLTKAVQRLRTHAPTLEPGRQRDLKQKAARGGPGEKACARPMSSSPHINLRCSTSAVRHFTWPSVQLGSAADAPYSGSALSLAWAENGDAASTSSTAHVACTGR